MPVLIDEMLFGHQELWAARGPPDPDFPIDPATLEELSGGRPAVIPE